MKAIITGAGGFCGRHLTEYLQELRVDVHTLSERDYGTPLHHCIPDVTDIVAISSVLKSVKPDFVFHLAGINTSTDPHLFYRLNTHFAVALLYAIEEAGLDECVVMLAGTSAEYGNVSAEQLPIHEGVPANPYNHYGISKLAQTLEGLAAYKKGKRVIVTRPFNVIGPGMNKNLVLQSFASQIVKIREGKASPEIKVGNLESTRDFIDVKDVVRIYWKVVNSPFAYGEIINVCTGKGTTINEMLLRLIQLSGVNAKVVIDDSRYKPIDVPEHYGCTKKMERITGYTPVSDLDISLKRILDW